MKEQDIEIYRTLDGKLDVKVTFDNETVWLNQNQIEILFDIDRSSINKHISNIYKTKELDKNSTCAKFAQVQIEGGRRINRKVNHYNLDVIISVGYRVNSKKGTQFRIWANKILKQYLIQGYSINENLLAEKNEQLLSLQKSVKMLSNVIVHKELSNDESRGLLQIITDYAYALDTLDRYDYQTLSVDNTDNRESYKLTYLEAISQIKLAKNCR